MARHKVVTALSIFGYDDYRKYLEDRFEEMKRTKRRFSFRSFSKSAGIGSPNFPQQVIAGHRNLTPDTVAKFAEALQLGKKELEYFDHLVHLNQAKNIEEKNFYFKKVYQSKNSRDLKKIEKAQYLFCVNWFIPVIREMVELEDFAPDPEWICSRISPTITKIQAEKAIKVLKELDLIIQSADGKYVKRDRSLSSGNEIRNLYVKNFHTQMIQLGKESIERYPSEKREVSSLTLSVTEHQFAAIKQRIADFRKELLDIATSEEQTTKIYQLNFQFFPLIKDGGRIVDDVKEEEEDIDEDFEDEDEDGEA